MTQIIVIGGGVAGLMAALHLAERGVKVLLLEADPCWIGGRLRDGAAVELEHGARRWRFPGEHGVHGIWSPYVNLKGALVRHKIMPTLVPSVEETWIFGRGAQVRKAAVGSAIHSSPVPAPFHYLHLFTRPSFLNMLTPHDLIALFPVLASLFAAMSIDPLAEHKALTGMSLADLTKGWSPNLRSFFAGLARNALAAHPEEVPASGFIAFLRFYTLLRRDSWIFGYLPGTGGACVAEPLAKRATELGCGIRMGARVTRLDRSGELWQAQYSSDGGSREIATAALVVLALDAPATATLLRQSPATSELAAALRFPGGVPTAIIRLWFKGTPLPIASSGIFSGDFVVDNFFWLHQLQPAYREWSQATGGSAVEMHIYGPPELLAQPDAALLAQVITDSYRAFPELAGQLIHSVLLRNAATHTLFSVGEPGSHLGVVTPWPGLFACGDWVYHPAPALYLERATVTGIAAANAALAELELEQWPLLPHPEPEWLAGKIAGGLWRFRQWELRRRGKEGASRTRTGD